MRGEVDMGKITGICISEKRGVQKHLITEANIVCDWGIEGDAHGGKWHRQISLLSKEKVDAFKAKGADIHPGSFGENLIVEGVDFSSMPVGTRFVIGDVVLEMTQIGKECHNHCLIYKTMGDCIMPREGVFAVVLHGGELFSVKSSPVWMSFARSAVLRQDPRVSWMMSRFVPSSSNPSKF